MSKQKSDKALSKTLQTPIGKVSSDGKMINIGDIEEGTPVYLGENGRLLTVPEFSLKTFTQITESQMLFYEAGKPNVGIPLTDGIHPTYEGFLKYRIGTDHSESVSKETDDDDSEESKETYPPYHELFIAFKEQKLQIESLKANQEALQEEIDELRAQVTRHEADIDDLDRKIATKTTLLNHWRDKSYNLAVALSNKSDTIATLNYFLIATLKVLEENGNGLDMRPEEECVALYEQGCLIQQEINNGQT